VDIIRFGLFNIISPTLLFESVALATASAVMFIVATVMLAKLNI